MRPRRLLAPAVWLGLAAATLPLLTSVRKAHAQDDPPATGIEQVVMYGVDDDTNVLLRYTFSSDEYQVVGELRDQSGSLVDGIESLGFIPNGPHKGLYGVANYDDDNAARLARISLLDATVTVYDGDVGFGNVEGMVATRDPDSNQWAFYATQSGAGIPGSWAAAGPTGGNSNGGGGVAICHTPPGNPGNAHTILVSENAAPAHLAHGDSLGFCAGDGGTFSDKNLISIDPATGLGSMVMQLDSKFEGLAQGPNGLLYAAAANELWAIDLYMGTVTLVGTHAYHDVEALEYAFGDNDPHIEIEGLSPDWTGDGVLFGFSDIDNAVLILNAETGEAIQFDCSVDTTDCEGMVFLTEQSDPMFAVLNTFD